MFSGGALSTRPPKAIFVEELGVDQMVCHDAAYDRAPEPWSSVAVYGGGSFIGAALTKFHVMSAATWRNPSILSRNIMRQPQNGRFKAIFDATKRKFSLTECAATV